MEDGEEITVDYHLIVSIALVVIQVFKFIGLCCCTSCIPFGVNFIWIGIELIIVIGLGISTLEVATAITAPFVSISLSYIVISTALLKLHLDLMAHHLTEKEYDARTKTCERLQVEDELIT